MSELSFDEVFKKITDNPDLMSQISKIAKEADNLGIEEALPKIIDVIKPQIDGNSSEKDNEEQRKTDTPAAKTPKSDDASYSVPFKKLSEKISKNSKLLIALKPYLSKERSDIIESIVKLAQIADLMKLAR